jgi:hypothetical protein
MDREEPTEPPVELTAGEKPERLDPQPAVAHAPWVRPISSYGRFETTIAEDDR